MKKILMMAVALVMAVTMNAQSEKGAMSVGGNFNIGLSDGYTNFGIGAKYSYNFIDHLRGETSFDYYFKKDAISMWDWNVNLHWVFDIKEKHGLYPLAGFALVGTKVDLGFASASSTDFGFNLGGGWEYRISDHFKTGIEAKYQWADGGRGIISVGAAYIF